MRSRELWEKSMFHGLSYEASILYERWWENVKQLFRTCKLLPWGAVDDLMHYCTMPKAECNSA